MKARCAAGLLAERTADAYARNADRWLAWLDAAGIVRPTPADVLAYVASLRDRGLKAASVNAGLDAVRGLYRFAETRNLNPAIARSVRGLRVGKDAPLDALSRDAVAGLLNHADGASMAGLRDRALVHVMFATGLRHVWAVQYVNGMGNVILDTLEVGGVPVSVLAAKEDFEDSAERLAEILTAFRS